MQKARKNVKWNKLNDRVLSKVLADCGLPKTSYRVLVWDLNDDIIGAVRRNGKLQFINGEQAEKIIKMINRMADEKEL